jgi:hypothetical protein
VYYTRQDKPNNNAGETGLLYEKKKKKKKTRQEKKKVGFAAWNTQDAGPGVFGGGGRRAAGHRRCLSPQRLPKGTSFLRLGSHLKI